MCADWKGLLKEEIKLENRDDKSIIYLHADRDNMMLTLYVLNKIEKLNILVLSSMHDLTGTSRHQIEKPSTLCFYDKNSGQIDVVHMMMKKKLESSIQGFAKSVCLATFLLLLKLKYLGFFLKREVIKNGSV